MGLQNASEQPTSSQAAGASSEPVGLAAGRPRSYSLDFFGHGPLSSPAEPEARAKPAAGRRGAGLVLIVDDSQIAREMYSEYLAHRGFWAVTAPDGEASIPLAHNLKPDVIVMDLAMPRLDGVSAIRRLRQSALTRRIPVILLTGHAVQAIQQGALEAGVDVFLTKPCLPEDLEGHIQRLTHGRPSADS